MSMILSISAVRNNPGIPTTATSRYLVILLHDVIIIASRETVDDILSLLFNPYRCFWLSAHRQALMDKYQFSFSNSRCSSAAIFSSSFIWDGFRGKNASIMWNLFISFDTLSYACFPHFFMTRFINTCFVACCVMCAMS